VFERYELLGVQRLPRIATSHTMTKPSPEVLANEIIEWDRQTMSCIGCHSRARVATFVGMASSRLRDADLYQESRCEQICGDESKCNFCQQVGDQVCSEAQCQGHCRAVERGIILMGPPVKRYSLASMAWIYDRIWMHDSPGVKQ
jgi:hypothetical protein